MANWAADLKLDVAGVDEDHAHLVMLINELDEAVAAHRGKTEISDLMSRILSLAGEHFCREEQAMRRSRYADFTEHKHLHDDLVRELRQSAAAVVSGERTPDRSLVDWLRTWLADHISTEDRKFAESGGEGARLSA